MRYRPAGSGMTTSISLVGGERTTEYAEALVWSAAESLPSRRSALRSATRPRPLVASGELADDVVVSWSAGPEVVRLSVLALLGLLVMPRMNLPPVAAYTIVL